MGPNDAWWVQSQVSNAYPLICWHVPYAHASSKVRSVIVFKWLSVVHMVECEAAIVLQSKPIKLFRDVATGPNLSLTTDHMCLLHSLDFGCIQWSRCRKCFCLYLLLLLTVHPWRFPFHTQDMILARSYHRLSSFAIVSVDGCCHYIIIHNSILHRTWL